MIINPFMKLRNMNSPFQMEKRFSYPLQMTMKHLLKFNKLTSIRKTNMSDSQLHPYIHSGLGYK